jgi:hypothetical protein
VYREREREREKERERVVPPSVGNTVQDSPQCMPEATDSIKLYIHYIFSIHASSKRLTIK